MKVKIYDFKGDQNYNNINFEVEKIDDLELKSPLKINFSVKKSYIENFGDVFEIDVSYSTQIKVECVRCLKEIVQDLNDDFKSKFIEPKNYKLLTKTLSLELEIEPDLYEEACDGEIDIVQLVREQILLHTTLYPVCDPSCEDVSIIEKYKDDGIDQRWAKLLDL